MPDHIKLILRHAAFGFVLSAAFIALLMYFNVANLWHLGTHTSEGPIALAMMFVFCGITFGSAQVGYKIMMMTNEDDGGQGGKRDGVMLRSPVAIPIPVEDPRTRR